MTRLDCCVRGCSYQKDNRCTRGDIHVQGSSADQTSDTNCGSFAEKRTYGTSNSNYTAPDHAEISCEAKKCVFNESGMCGAEHIGITGSNADTSSETECASFRSR